MNIFIWAASRLPSTYQEVERIQSSWTQYIDTWKTVSGDVKADYTYMPKETVTSSTAWWLLVFIDNDRRNNWFGSSNTYTYYGGNTSNNEGYTVWTLQQDVLCHDIVAKSWCSRTLNWTTVSYVPSSSYPSPTWTLKLFVSQRAGSITNYWKTRMYSFKRWDSWVLTQDLIPCYRKSDNVIGLYDLVNNQFYTNSWTGTFSKWADVYINELKMAYLWAGTITETYTVPNTSNTTNSVSIYKSGYKIKSITRTTTASNSATWANYDMRIRNWTSWGNYFVWRSWIGSNETSSKTYKLTFSQNSTETDLWTSSGYSYAYTTINIVDTINSDGTWTSQYWSHNNSGSFSSNSTAMSVLNWLFSWNDTVGYFRTNASWAALSNNTITVVYEAV